MSFKYFLVVVACLLLVLPAIMDPSRRRVKIINEEPQIDIFNKVSDSQAR